MFAAAEHAVCGAGRPQAQDRGARSPAQAVATGKLHLCAVAAPWLGDGHVLTGTADGYLVQWSAVTGTCLRATNVCDF